MPVNVTPDSLLSIEISISEGDAFWKCTMDVSNPGDFVQFAPNDQFVITLQGEDYSFYVDNTSLNKSGPANMRGTVGGIGLGVDLDYPRKKVITKVWPELLASQILTDLLGARVVGWNFVDWLVPADRFGVQFSSRVSAAKQLVEAAGGVLEGTSESNFVVRSKWPISPWNYATATPDHVFDEQDSILSAQFDYSLTKYLDTVRVMDLATGGYRDRVEVLDDPGGDVLKKLVRVYPSPYRDTFILTHTGPPSTGITFLGISVREELQTLEIVNGQTTAAYPVFNLISVSWIAKDLLSLYHEPFSDILYSSHPTEKFSLAIVKYQTKCFEYNVSALLASSVQFLIEDAPL